MFPNDWLADSQSNSKLVRMGFIVDEVALGQILLFSW
jgi:hypothetical protein